jgi:hypothetical protein
MICVGKTRQSIVVPTPESACSWRHTHHVRGLCYYSIRIEAGRVTCGMEHDLSLKRYVTMSVMWTIVIVWLALQIPLAVLIGKSIKFGTVGHANKRAQSRDPRYYPGVVWC